MAGGRKSIDLQETEIIERETLFWAAVQLSSHGHATQRSLADEIRRRPLAEDFLAPCWPGTGHCAPCASADADESGGSLPRSPAWAGTGRAGHRFSCDPGNPSARSDKMWCTESDFEPQACSDLDNVGTALAVTLLPKVQRN